MAEEQVTQEQEAKQDDQVTATSEFLQKYFDDKSFEIAVDFVFPDTLAGLVEKFGENIVHSNSVGSMTVSIQGNIRRWAKKYIEDMEKEDKEVTLEGLASYIQEKADAWKPGVVNRTKKSEVDKVADKASKIQDPDQIDELIAKLREKKAQIKK